MTKILILILVTVSVLNFSCQKDEYTRYNSLLINKDWVYNSKYSNNTNQKIIYRFEDNGIFTYYELRETQDTTANQNYYEIISYNDTLYQCYSETASWNWSTEKIDAVNLYEIGSNQVAVVLDIKSISRRNLEILNLETYYFGTFEKNNNILNYF